MSITHEKVSAVSDGGDTSMVQPSDWNAAHTVTAPLEIDGSAANGFVVHSGNPTTGKKFWIDTSYFLNGPTTYNICIRQASDGRALLFSNTAGDKFYGFEWSGNTLSFKYLTGGVIPITFNTDGSLQHNSTKIGFYGATPGTKPTITGSRTDGTALASLLTALATLGLLVDSSTA